MHRFIHGGLEQHMAALKAEFNAQKAALKERLASESDPALKKQLAAEIKTLREQHRQQVRDAPRSLY